MIVSPDGSFERTVREGIRGWLQFNCIRKMREIEEMY